MGSRGERFAGLTVALVTSFKNGAVDETGLRKLVDFHVESGTDCVSPVGTTGECPTLSHDEHERVIASIAARDGEQAFAHMQQHLEASRERLRAVSDDQNE